MATEKMVRKPTHPGEFFRSEILEERGVSITEAAKHLGIARKTLTEFVNGKSSCSNIMSQRLAQATGTGVAFWINMQSNLDKWEADNIDDDLGVDTDFWQEAIG